MSESTSPHLIAVIGAGPAGLFAARELAARGQQVVLFNRDIKPGGLAEYGIYPDKVRMKQGLRNQFRQILANPNVHYCGNVVIGSHGDFTLDDLRRLGAQTLLVTVGAQATKWLGIPGEDLQGVYHAKDIVYHYNRLPPFSEQRFAIGRRVAIVGMGNVMMDIAHYLIHQLKVDEVNVVARRGPAEVKFSTKELEGVQSNLDMAAYDAEVNRVGYIMQNIGQNPEEARQYFYNTLSKAVPSSSDTRMMFHFLASPVRILGDARGHTRALEVEDNTLVLAGGEVKARGLGTTHLLDVDTVIFAIGDRVDESLGLPVRNASFIRNNEPRYPVDGQSYEVFDPQSGHLLEDVFVAGWARQASTGLVGVAHRDGVNGANAVMQYLVDQPPAADGALEGMLDAAALLPGHLVIGGEDLKRLEAAERERALQLGVEDFKFATNEEMLEAIGLQPAPLSI